MSEQQQLPGGSFGAATGGTEALRSAMESRGMDTSVLDQVTPGAVAGAAPVPQNPSDVTAAQAAVPQAATPEPAGTPAAPPVQPNDPELAIALEALGGFVKDAGKTRKTVAEARTQGIV